MFAHGDYQDKETTYDTKWVDLSTDKKKISNFIKTVSSTCGYDSDECYELVLRQVGGILAWSFVRAFILLTCKLFQIAFDPCRFASNLAVKYLLSSVYEALKIILR